MNKYFGIIAIVTLSMILSCSRTLYNVEFTNPDVMKDTTNNKLFIRIANLSSTGISSFGLYVESGLFMCNGIPSKDTTAYFPIYPFYTRPGYKMCIFKIKAVGKSVATCIDARSIDNIGETKLTAGYYTILVRAKIINGRIRNHEIEIQKD